MKKPEKQNLRFINTYFKQDHKKFKIVYVVYLFLKIASFKVS